METRIKAKRKLLKESDLDSSLRLADAVRNSPTVRTPPVPIPPAPAENELPAVARARQEFEDVKSIVNSIYSKGRHRKWAKAIKQHALGGEYFDASDNVSKLAKIIVALKAEIVTAGLDPDVFDMDNPALVVHRSVNELVYDTLGYIVEPYSMAYGYLLGTEVDSDRDGRRALVDLIKGMIRMIRGLAMHQRKEVGIVLQSTDRNDQDIRVTKLGSRHTFTIEERTQLEKRRWANTEEAISLKEEFVKFKKRNGKM
ncbi:hypothetical protein CYMTET_55652 [Cymbomonas tetramitiformis]|uniref:Uncharacterized protein n=1 Tax=Cymbomonas tetramitiformis TaxID=36881 RepID=A0AAE0BCK3_9CHLO|nr:hypothetical protein CYMTET_55652 [Cymbomonas tetramitiformis]